MATHEELFKTLDDEIAKISGALNKENEEKEKIWEDSCFLPIRKAYTGKRRGEILSKLILTFIKLQGFDVKLRGNTHNLSSVIVIGNNDKKMQVKTSMLSTQDSYMFQQIRKEDDFDALIFFGVSPRNAHWWIINRGEIIDAQSGEWEKKEKLNFQHGKANKIITFNIQRVPGWLAPLGGNLDKGLRVFSEEVERLVRN